MRTSLRLTWTALTLACAAACGGDALEEDVGRDAGPDGVTRVAEVYLDALGRGDGPRACSLMEPSAQQWLIARRRVGDCLAAVRATRDLLTEAQRAALADVDVEPRSVRDRTARATVALAPELSTEVAATQGALSLVREEEHWVIAAPAG